MLGQSISGGVSLGKDTSGNLKLTMFGIAASTPDKRFICIRERKPVDVTDLIIDGTDSFIYRVPVSVEQVQQGDIIIKSDDPFNVIFVDRCEEDGDISGLELINSDHVRYRPPNNLLGLRFVVKAISMFDAFSQGGVNGNASTSADGKGVNGLMLALLLGKDNAGSTTGDLKELLLLQAMGGQNQDLNPLVLLSLAKGMKGDAFETMLLMQSLGAGSSIFGTSPKALGMTNSPKTTKSSEQSSKQEPSSTSQTSLSRPTSHRVPPVPGEGIPD